MAMLDIKLKRAFKHDSIKYKKCLKKYSPNSTKIKEELVCFECNKLGHMKLKNKKLENDRIQGQESYGGLEWQWRDISDDSQVENFCIMALEDDNDKFSQKKN